MSNRKYRILVVDDEPDIATIFKLGLEKEGFEVEAITDPVKALDFYQKAGQFDLALIDIKMPKMNGFELYRELLKKDERLRVCFITAFEMYYDEFRRVFPKVKVECFIKKPSSIETIAGLVKKELASTAEYLEVPSTEGPVSQPDSANMKDPTRLVLAAYNLESPNADPQGRTSVD